MNDVAIETLPVSNYGFLTLLRGIHVSPHISGTLSTVRLFGATSWVSVDSTQCEVTLHAQLGGARSASSGIKPEGSPIHCRH